MKKLTFILWILLLSIVSNAHSSYFYYAEGKKHYFELDTKHIFISVIERDAIYSFGSDRSIQTPFQIDITKSMQLRTNYKRYCAKLSFNDSLSEGAYWDIISEIKNSRNDIIVSPYFKDDIGLSNFFYVKPPLA
jgi:hypothetical protein